MQISNQLISSLFGNSSEVNHNRQSQSADKQVTGAAFDFEDVFKNLAANKSEEAAKPSSNYNKSAEEEGSIKAPYSYLADDSGVINYKGVKFQCTGSSLCLGDVSNKNNVLIIPLAGGGCLQVNRNKYDDLAKAIGMFSPEDTKRILDAIAIDGKAKSKNMEIDNAISKAFENISKE